MKVYKVVLLVVDFDRIADRMKEVIENVRYPNHCLSPKVMSVEEAEIGEWEDSHPLNFASKQKEEFERLFPAGKPAKE